MIKKERRIPLKILKLEALLRRLSLSHPKRRIIEEELAKSLAGYRGEQAIDYYLRLLPEKSYFIFHDVRLKQNEYFFQIDTLILSPFFILIIEVKNIKGTLYFDNLFQQFIRKTDEKEEGFPDPLLQVDRQLSHMKEWLHLHKMPQIPIQSLVVISKPTTIIKISSQNSNRYRNLIHSAILPTKIEEFKKMYKQEVISFQQLQKVSNILLEKHTPSNSDILKQFQINESDLVKGVSCPACTFLSMNRLRKKWVCPRCDFSSKNAHQLSLCDYALLLGQTITNKKLCDFFQISSRYVA